MLWEMYQCDYGVSMGYLAVLESKVCACASLTDGDTSLS